jgi:hypothetical protein
MSRASQLRTKLESLGAVLTVIEDSLLVVVPEVTITPAIRNRIARERRELVSLAAESERQNVVVGGPEAEYPRLVVSAALDEKCTVTGAHVAHGALILSIRLGRAFTGVMLAPGDHRPGDEAKAMAYIENLKTLKRWNSHGSDPVLH